MTVSAAALRTLVPSDLAGRAALLSLVTNLVLMVLKLAVGLITGSVAVFSDGVDSGQDVLAAGIAFLSVRYGARPPDVGHPYGHGRAETVAAGVQSLLIAGGSALILYRAVDRILHPPQAIDTGLGVIVMVLAAGLNLLVLQYARRAARLTGSPAVASDARHLWTNVVQAAAVLLGLGLVATTGEVLFDALVALALGAYVALIAASLFFTALSDVLDRSLTEEEVVLVEEAILAERDEIAGFHRLRTRRSGQRPLIDFHLIVRPEMTVAEAHAITDRIEERIRARWPQAMVTIHVEPEDGRFRGPLDSRSRSRGREGELQEGKRARAPRL